MPSDLLDRLATGEILVCDGATGTMLYAGGCGPGDCPEAWALAHDEVLRKVHRAYIAAGADVNLTSTIGGNALKLNKYGLGNQTRAISRGHAELLGEVIAAEA
ncbi:MAG: homocysteine S-methyltransferase family protein, partial [Anaerolineae bacterium]|nr:homocysteine S-methyltransferase family protein [Anaerolineae bacterium]